MENVWFCCGWNEGRLNLKSGALLELLFVEENTQTENTRHAEEPVESCRKMTFFMLSMIRIQRVAKVDETARVKLAEALATVFFSGQC